MYYQTNIATSDNQDVGNLTLSQILSAIQSLSPDESQQVALLTSILAAFAPLSTGAKQDTGNTSLASILATHATAANQTTGNTTLASILSAFSPLATASSQTTGNTTLASILTALTGSATAAKQDIGNASLASIDAKIGSSTSVITSVAQTTSSVLFLAANANRRGFSLYNDTGAKCYVAMAGTASSTAFSTLLAMNAGYEPIQTAVYKGAISGMWASGNSGFMRITELT